MSYNTVQQFLDLSPLSGSFDNLSSIVIQESLDIGGAMIDDAARVSHTLPLINVSAQIRHIERVLASYNLVVLQGSDTSQDGTDRFKQMYIDIVGKDGWLDKLAKGQIKLQDSTVSTAQKGGIKFYHQGTNLVGVTTNQYEGIV